MEAIEGGERAVAACPLQDPSRAVLLSALAVLRLLFMQSRGLGVLYRAINLARQAIDAAPPDHPAMARYQNTLSGCLQFLYARTGEESVLVAGVEAACAAIAATPEGAPTRQDYLDSLGLALQTLAADRRDAELMREAVQVGRSALTDSPAGGPSRTSRLNNLALPLIELAILAGEAGHAAEAASVLREATAAWPADHPYRATGLWNLGRALIAESSLGGSESELGEAERCLAKAGGDRSAHGVVRLACWSSVSMLASRREDGASDALAAAEATAGLLPQLAPRAMTLTDRYYWLSQITTLAARAAAAAVAAGRPERAVELLEQTRGVAIADLLDARGNDEARLQAKAPGLADELAELRSRLAAAGDGAIGQPGITDTDSAAGTGTTATPLMEAANARLDAEAAWDDLIARIRAVDGFAGFGAAPSARELTRLAGSGPIVLVYADDARGDALILTGDPASPARLVPLPGLTNTAAVAQANALSAACRLDPAQRAGRTERRTAQAKLLDVLAWPWDTVADPVLGAIGCDSTPGQDDQWPRLWWCPAGALAELPLHCAGHHADLTSDDADLLANPRTVLDRVVSSYATTLRNLRQARDHRASRASHASKALGAFRGGRDRVLVVAVPDIAGAEELPGAAAEAEIISALTDRSKVLTRPGRAEVLRALPGYEIVHFACHARLSPVDPSISHLVLHDHEHAPLTVADIGA